MISRSSRLLHTALVVACGAGIVYAPVQARTSLSVPLGQSGTYGRISIGNLAPLSQRRPSRSSQVRGWEGSWRVGLAARRQQG